MQAAAEGSSALPKKSPRQRGALSRHTLEPDGSAAIGGGAAASPAAAPAADAAHVADAASSSSSPSSPPSPSLQLHYYSSWDQPVLHHSINGGEWQGLKMQKVRLPSM